MRGGKSGPSKSVGSSKGGAGKPSSSSKVMKSKSAKKPQGRVSAEEKKGKSANSHGQANKKKKKVYTAAELGIPELNGITPEGVTKPPNMKKGKKFVDDNEGMAAIMAMVMAEKDGNIESKMLKARHLEELREAKKAEAEARMKEKKSKLDAVKDSIRNKKKNKDKAPKQLAKERNKPQIDEALNILADFVSLRKEGSGKLVVQPKARVQ